MIDYFIKIIEIHMRAILKFKYVFTSKIYFHREKVAENLKIRKVKNEWMFPFFW